MGSIRDMMTEITIVVSSMTHSSSGKKRPRFLKIMFIVLDQFHGSFVVHACPFLCMFCSLCSVFRHRQDFVPIWTLQQLFNWSFFGNCLLTRFSFDWNSLAGVFSVVRLLWLIASGWFHEKLSTGLFSSGLWVQSRVRLNLTDCSCQRRYFISPQKKVYRSSALPAIIRTRGIIHPSNFASSGLFNL